MNLLRRLLPVRREELWAAGLMTGYFFLAMACVSLVKSLQNALYLGRVGFDFRLPLIYVALALASGPVVLLYRWLGRRVLARWVNLITILFLIANLAAFSILLRNGQAWIYPVFYLWAGIFSVLLPMLGWVVSYSLYNTREAKRLYSLLGAGGILGGIFGGYYSAANWSGGSESLIIHVIAMLTVMMILILLLESQAVKPSESGQEAVPSQRVSFGRLLGSDYLRALAWLMLMTGLVTTAIDLQFKWALQQEFFSEDEIRRFVGAFLGSAFLFSALFQLVATNRFLKRYGAVFGLMLLPVSLLAGSFGIALLTAFWASALLRLIDGGLRNSIFRTSAEILFIPIRGVETVAAKSLIDLVAFRVGDALGATFFLIAVLAFQTSAGHFFTLIAVAAGVWALLGLRLREGYLTTLRRSMEIKSDPSTRRVFEFDEAVAERTLVEALESRNPSKVHFALRRLLSRPLGQDAVLEEYQGSGEALVQKSIFRSRVPDWTASVAPLIDSDDPDVSSAAFALMIRYQSRIHLDRLQASLDSDDIPDALILNYLQAHVQRPKRYMDSRRVLKWARQADDLQAAQLAHLMGCTAETSYRDILWEWAHQGRSRRSRAAIEALGPCADSRSLEFLASRLAQPWSRQSARKALIRFGNAAVDPLGRLIRSSKTPLSVRREIPRILTKIDTQSARAALVAALYLPDAAISYRALKGLNKIRNHSDLSYDQMTFMPLLQLWARQYYELLNLRRLTAERQGPGVRLLTSAVDERLDWTIEKIFRALGLFFPAGEAYYSYLGYTSDRRELQANAVELIESRMPEELRKTLIPIFSDRPAAETVRQGRRLFGLKTAPREIIRDVIFERDPWLKCCVLAAVADWGRDGLEPVVRQAEQDIHPQVRETARWVLRRWREKDGTRASSRD